MGLNNIIVLNKIQRVECLGKQILILNFKGYKDIYMSFK